MHNHTNPEFESARHFEPIQFGDMGPHVGTLRFLLMGGSPENTVHANPKGVALFGPKDTGTLLLDVRPRDYPDYPIAEVKFDIDGHTLKIVKTELCLSFLDRGLMAYLIMAAQRATNWRYPLRLAEQVTRLPTLKASRSLCGLPGPWLPSAYRIYAPTL